MDPDGIQQLIIILVFLGFSAFFSVAKTAVVTLGKLNLKGMLDKKIKGAEEIEKMNKNPNKLLTSILVGNNIVNLGASSIATMLVTDKLGSRPLTVVISTTVITAAVLFFGEIIPKIFTDQNTEKVALLVYRPLGFFSKLLTPAVFAVTSVTNILLKLMGVDHTAKKPFITESELKTMVNVSHAEGVLEIEESRIINNVFEFGDSHAKDVMTPRMDIVAVRKDASREEILGAFDREQFSRMPVYGNDMDDIVGMLHLKDFIFDVNRGMMFDINKYIREAYFTYESKPVLELFHLMRTKRIALAVVLDEYGGTAGIITLEDLVEEIVGDISDEYDDQELEITVVNEKEYVVEPATKLSEVNEKLGIKLESKDYESIGGYVIGLIDRIPEKNEVIEYGGIRFIIEEVEKNRIEKIRMCIA